MDLQFDSKVCFVNKNLILVRHSIAASTLALPDLDEMKGLPAVGMKFGFQMPNTDQAKGIGTNQINIFSKIIVQKRFGKAKEG